MKGSECRLIEYMEGSKKRFIIPVYQRNYDWKTENCKQLYDDLIKVIKHNRRSHFFGSLVSVYNPSGRNTEFLVIDGQQRLTTVSLLLLAMYNLISAGVVITQDDSLGKQIYEEFLVDKYQPEEKRIKLKPVKNDQKAFGKLFAEEKDHIRESNLTANYNYFYDRIQKQEITIDELFDAICSLEIINITLNNDDNPQLIFESLNSTGLDLSEGDKIRNFILMGLPTSLQDSYYENYWNRIEECTKYDVSSYIRDYLSVKQQSIPSQKRIYANFKEYVELVGVQTEDLLKELLAYARRYQILLNGGTHSKKLDACIYRLNRLETTVTRPFFLEVLRLLDEEKLDIAQVADIFLTTENYLFRRTICDLPTNALNKIFLMLHREVVRYDGTENDYVAKVKYALLVKKERARFPDDDEFATAFTERQIYLMNSKNKVYILERLENSGTAEDKDVYGHCDDGVYSIEHIMPQHLTPTWIKELGEDYEQIHEQWLHRIANLTLTAYNSKYSNNSFVEKKTMQNGFDDSGIRMNTYIAKKENWTLKELEERNAHLMDRALTIWARPATAFHPEEKQLDSCTLEDDEMLSGRLIARFSYKNTEQPVTSWVEMYQKVLKILYAEDKTIITKLAVSSEDNIALHFSMNPTEFTKNVEIGDGIFVWTNTNTQSKLSVLKRIFKLYGAEPSDLVFYLRDENGNAEDEAGTRNELRRRYWAFALEYIHEMHGDASFSNVHPSKENWISGFFGVSGFSLNCVAKRSFADLIGKADYQCIRTQNYFTNNGGSVTFYNNDKTEKFVVDSKKIRRIYTVCVTVDNFNVFEAKIEKTNFFNSASGTIAISIDDLDVYEDYFDSEICFLHFLKHRKAATRIRNLTLNDELDHLGLYISQNSYEEYVNDFRDCNSFMANGFREELDAYYAGVHNSLIAKDKPTQVIPQYYREIFGYLEKNDIDGRTEFGEFILDFAYDERERLDESIRGRILREKQLGYMTPMWVEFDLFSYCCFVNIPDIESLSERHRKKYVYANMIDRKQNLCWYIFVDLDRNGHVNSIIARKVLSSQYVSDGFTTDEIHEYISEMKSRRKAHGTNMPSVHKRKVYPNELCPCGSGMKYKKCCGKNK